MKGESVDVREARLLHAVMHVVRYGKLGKQSKARLKAALRENADGRTHGGDGWIGSDVAPGDGLYRDR